MTEKQTSFEQYEESSDNQEVDGARDDTRVVAPTGVPRFDSVAGLRALDAGAMIQKCA